LVVFVGAAWGEDTWRVVRKARLLTKPSSATGQKIKTLRPPELVTETGHRRSGDYVQVRDGAGNTGWVYEAYLAPEEEEGPTSGSNPAPVSTSLNDATAFRLADCPPEGNPSPRGTRFEALKALNIEKNRTAGPATSDLRHVALSSFLDSDDPHWTTDQAVELVGYVGDVKSGGPETCNCRSSDPRHYDTHIEILKGPTDRGLPMIVEVTPAWRGLMTTAGRDWSTEGLAAAIDHRWVRVRGWLFFDSEHRQNSENTNPDGDHLWRKTAWEIHPVTDIEVVAAPVP
jgi:hypothetical protein